MRMQILLLHQYLNSTKLQKNQFQDDGFVIVRNVVDPEKISQIVSRYPLLFKGSFETGVSPDEFNWKFGRDDPSLTRQICNGWKSDRIIASVVLREDVGRICAGLMGWEGVRLGQDNVIWKPPGAQSLVFHQDDSYCGWFEPSFMVTCWVTLDDTSEKTGTIEYAKGSHKWGLFNPVEEFHAPENYKKYLFNAAKEINLEKNKIEIIPIKISAGDAVIHHGRMWHGSGANHTSSTDRRAIVTHCIPVNAKFSENSNLGMGKVYGKYKNSYNNEMEESVFPILWSRNSLRSEFIKQYLDSTR